MSRPAITAMGLILPRTTMQAWMRISESQQKNCKTLAGWRPLPDSNRNRRFRKPELYPVELRGQLIFKFTSPRETG